MISPRHNSVQGASHAGEWVTRPPFTHIIRNLENMTQQIEWTPDEHYSEQYVEVDETDIIEIESDYRDDIAEDHLRAVAYHRSTIDNINAHADREMEKINAWRDRERTRVERRMVWHESSLTAWFSRIDAASKKLINGTLKRTKGRERIDIVDESVIPIEFLVEKVTSAPDKKALLAHVKATGEIPEGVDIVRGEDSIKIVTK